MSVDSGVAAAFVVRGPLVVEALAEVRNELCAELQSGRPLRIDLRGVAACDTAGIQLLCATATSARRLGRSLTWWPSAAVNSAAARVGVDLDALAGAAP